jgi:ADP-heptose:LPS heptosyltransferase
MWRFKFAAIWFMAACFCSFAPRERMKILLIAMSGIGDTLIATPLIHELHANFRDAQIDVLVMWAGAKGLLEGNPYVSRVWQKNMIKDGVLNTLPFLKDLRRERYDISLNAHTQGRLAYRGVAALIGAKLRVGHAYDNTRAWERMLIHKTVSEDYSVHSIVNNNHLLPLIGAKTLLPSHEMEMVLTEAERSWANDFVSKNDLAGRECLGIHVGSGGTKKPRAEALAIGELHRTDQALHRGASRSGGHFVWRTGRSGSTRAHLR